MADLPRCRPPHAKSPVVATAAVHTSLEPARALALGLRHRCAACGCPMPGEVYHVFHSAPGEYEHYPGDLFVCASIGPMHRVCALFAACHCPFLRYPISRRRGPATAGFEAHAESPRGDAAVIGFRRYGIYYRDHPTEFGRKWAWGYHGLIERIRFTTFKEVAPLYLTALETADIDTSSRMYFRHDDPRDRRRLRSYAQQDATRVAMMRAAALTVVEGQAHPLAWI